MSLLIEAMVDPLPPSKTIYNNVVHRKIVGSLKVSDNSLVFHSDRDGAIRGGEQAPFSWSTISKHQVSPAKHPKALLKLLMVDGRSNTFQFRERSELDRIRRDITSRLQQYKAKKFSSEAPSTSTPLESLSGKKRPRSDHLSAVSQSPPTKRNETAFGEVDSSLLATARASLLATNSQLRSQHHLLVEETMTFTEEEFWEKNNDLVEEECARMSGKAKTGTSNLIQSNLQILKGRVTLGVEEMRQIFILYPAVHKAYEEKVPAELSDEEFWKKYLQSEYFHRDRVALGESLENVSAKRNSNALNADGGNNGGQSSDDIFSNYDKKLQEDSSDRTTEKRKWGTNLAAGQFDLTSTFESDRGNLLEGPKDNHPANSADDGKGSQVIQKYNRHWAMVMHPEQAVAGSDLMQVVRKGASESNLNDSDAKVGGGTDEEMRKLVSFAQSTSAAANHAHGSGMEDLNNYEELTLRNVELYQQASRALDVTAGTFAGTKEAIGQIISKLDAIAARIRDHNRIDVSQRHEHSRTIDDAFPSPADGRQELLRLTKRMAEDAKSDADALEVVKSLPEDFKKRLHSYFRRSSELLRHFFGLRRLARNGLSKQASSPDSSRQHADAKIKRIVEVMEALFHEMEEVRKGFEQESIMVQMWDQVLNQLDWAFRLHKKELRDGLGAS